MYSIDPSCGKAFDVWCDLQGGGWTVFQRRMDGSVSFNRSWNSYVDGFGQNLNGMQFSTWDRDNDNWGNGNCVTHYGGHGWWYNSCFNCKLNGPYICGAVERNSFGVIWGTFRGHTHSLKYTEMKMRFN